MSYIKTYKKANKNCYFSAASLIFIIVGCTSLLLAYGPLIRDEVWFYLKEARSQKITLNDTAAQRDSVFARFLTTKPINIEPANEDFAVVIERIGLSAPIVKDVTVIDEDAYKRSLKEGIAHAASSNYPSKDPGNTYLFAHASVNFWELGKHATEFNLLRKLEPEDRIHVFFEGDTYVYEVMNKEVYPGWNTFPLSRSVIEPILTLQTCDPPGTTINRLVVTAKLKEVL